MRLIYGVFSLYSGLTGLTGCFREGKKLISTVSSLRQRVCAKEAGAGLFPQTTYSKEEFLVLRSTLSLVVPWTLLAQECH
jgi:hypothetical protein